MQIIRSDGSRATEPFLDISDRLSTSSIEQGLLALAFHPLYQSNRRSFVAYTDPVGDAVVSEFLVSVNDPDLADVDSELEILRLAQPSSIHNIHQLEFGPDGYLYIGAGDGGPAEGVRCSRPDPAGSRVPAR